MRGFASPPRPSGAVPLPICDGEDFGSAALRLAGIAGIAFGWAPDQFWSATPAELAALATALTGDAPAPLAAADLAKLMEMHPDG